MKHIEVNPLKYAGVVALWMWRRRARVCAQHSNFSGHRSPCSRGSHQCSASRVCYCSEVLTQWVKKSQACRSPPFHSFLYSQKCQLNITRVGKTLFQMSTICPDLPQTEVPQACSISLSIQKFPSHATSNPCSPTPFFSSWSTLQTPSDNEQFHTLFLVSVLPPHPPALPHCSVCAR